MTREEFETQTTALARSMGGDPPLFFWERTTRGEARTAAWNLKGRIRWMTSETSGVVIRAHRMDDRYDAPGLAGIVFKGDHAIEEAIRYVLSPQPR